MKNFLIFLTLTVGLAGCASTGQVDKLESASETNSKLLKENEYRLGQLEASVASLNSQMAQLNNRVYEVRTRNGQKTSMTVVPILPQTTPAQGAAAAATGAAQPANRAEALLAQARRVAAERNQAAQGANPATQAGAPAVPGPASAATASTAPATGTAAATAPAPRGRMIDPAAAPTPIPAATPRTSTPKAQGAAGATGSVGRPVAGPSGSLAAQPASNPAALQPAALPPVDLPPTALPAAAQPATTGAGTKGNATTGTAVPVPAISASGLALPPEHPGLPPVGQTQATASPATSAAAAAAPATPASPAPTQRGEEAAYKAALNATLGGRTEEGLRLFHDFLQKYPHGRYAANADYWIGEGLYAQGKYHEALAQFQKVNDSYPSHHKNADALLKAGMTLNKLGDRTAAAEKYRTLMSRFPNSEAAGRARAMRVAN